VWPPPPLWERGSPTWPPLPPDASPPPLEVDRRSCAPLLEVDPLELRTAAQGRPAGAASATGPHAAAAAAPDLVPLDAKARSLPAILLEADGRRQGAAAQHDPMAGSAPMCALAAGSRV
jgi:hypothetical protein